MLSDQVSHMSSRLRSGLAVLVGALAFAVAPIALADPASTVHQVGRETAPLEFDNPCTGEHFTGVVTFHFASNIVSNGNVVHLFSTGSAQLRGESASGASYVGTSTFLETQTSPIAVPPPPKQVGVLLNPTFHVIRQGEDGTSDDFYLHAAVISHLDVATQTYTLSVDHFFAECR